MTYLVGLHNESDIHDVKLRVARVSVFLFFEREIECEHNRGTAKTTLKKKKPSAICATREAWDQWREENFTSHSITRRKSVSIGGVSISSAPASSCGAARKQAKKCQYPFLWYYPTAD